MLDRRSKAAMIPYCANHGVGLMTYGALCHGLFSGVWDAETVFPSEDWRSTGDVFGLPLFAGDNLRHNIGVATRLAAFAESLGLSLPQLAIAWVAHNTYIATALAGMRSAAEVEENVKAVTVRPSSDDLASVDAILASAVGNQGMSHYVVNERAGER